MRTREATIEDSESLAHIQVDSYRGAYTGILPAAYLMQFTYEEQTQDWRDLLGQAQHDLLYVIETDAGDIVGYALAKPGLTSIAPYDSELVALHIRKASQRQGAGRQLIAASARRLQQAGCASLMLWTLAQNPARILYERLGGRLIGEQEIIVGDNATAVEVAYGWPNIEALCANEGGIL